MNRLNNRKKLKNSAKAGFSQLHILFFIQPAVDCLRGIFFFAA